MIYQNLTSPEIGRLAPDAVAVVPIAAFEQHGDHCPVSVDTVITTELATRLEKNLPKEVLLLPTLWAGCSDHHLGFPGTVSISSDTYVRVLCDICTSLIQSGFTKIFLLNGHGGNQTPFAEALYRLGLDHPTVWIAAQSYWNLAANELRAQNFMESPRLTHACEYETSMMLALDESLVKMEVATGHRCERPSAFYDPLGYKPSRVAVSETFAQMTPNGAMGSPELATADKGRKLLDLITPVLVEFVQEFSAWPPKKSSAK